MNDRIKELITQCTERSDGGTWSSRDELNAEKFAELLLADIQEICKEQMRNYRAERLATSDFDEKNIYAEGEVACDLIMHRIRTRFGVS